MSSLTCYCNAEWWKAVILTQLAHGFKETGLLGFVLFVWLEVCGVRGCTARGWTSGCRTTSVRCVTALILLSTHIAFRAYLLQGNMTPSFNYIDNPLWFAETLKAQILNTAQVHWQYFRLLLWPVELSCDYSPKCIDECNEIGMCIMKPLMMYFLCLSVLALAVQRRVQGNRVRSDCVPLFGLGMTVVTILPGSHVFLKVGLLVAERLLYVPSMGVCLVLGWTAATVLEKHTQSRAIQTVVTILILALVGLGAARCIVRNFDWQNADTLYAAALQVCPDSARINNNVGTRLLRGGQPRSAIAYFDKAVAAVPNFALALHNRGLAAYMTQDKVGALSWFQKSLLTPDTSNAMAYNNMGIALKELGRHQEARESFAKAAALGHGK